MGTTDKTPQDSRIVILRRREQALKEAIAAEQLRQQRREMRDHARLVTIVGEALLAYAHKTPDFALMLQQVLKAAVADERQREFLAERGWS